MPSQEFYAILEMIIHPDVVEPEVLRDSGDSTDGSEVRASRAALPFVNNSPN